MKQPVMKGIGIIALALLMTSATPASAERLIVLV